MKTILQKVCNREHLTREEARDAMRKIMEGAATEAQIGALLVALKFKGEQPDEIIGFVEVMREKAVTIRIDDLDAVDMCGTGGDGSGTFNISTAASFVVAGAGVTVAKHGNRSISSACGSADVLKALGVNIDIPPASVEECINRRGIGFLFAPMFHPAMRYAARPRAELGVKTCFNLLGPMTNPAGVRRQLVGAFSPAAASTIAGVFHFMGVDKVCVIHSNDGMDEISLEAPTMVHEVMGENKSTYTVGSDSFSLPEVRRTEIRGSTAEMNADIIMRILNGELNPHRDIVLANAAMGLFVANRVRTFAEGTVMAAESIDSGAALAKLRAMREFTAA